VVIAFLSFITLLLTCLANTNMRILQRADAILTVMEGNTESLASRKRVTIGDLCAIHMSSQEAFGQNYVW